LLADLLCVCVGCTAESVLVTCLELVGFASVYLVLAIVFVFVWVLFYALAISMCGFVMMMMVMMVRG